MPSSNMQYYVRTEDGREYGPAEQDTLVQWAKSGRVTSDCVIRNSMVKKWTPAAKIPFLEGIVQASEEAVKQEKKSSMAMQAKSAVYSLNRPGRFKYVAATTGVRFGAWVVDMIVVGLVWAVLFAIASSAVEGGQDRLVCYAVFTGLALMAYLVYYALLMGLTAQTIGQWFWGIMVVRQNGDPVLVGRAFLFALVQLVVGWTSLLFVFVLPSKAALQDMICGLRVSRITVRDIAQASL